MAYKYQRARTSRVGLVHENQDSFRLPRGRLGRAATTIVEHITGLDDYAMAVAAYWVAVENRPKHKITLRLGARVVVKNWSEEE
jgi:hypothetical protein